MKLRTKRHWPSNGNRLTSANIEISQLYHLFNRMSERIRDQVAQIRDNEHKRQTLIANLSHDLRTPLTMIQG